MGALYVNENEDNPSVTKEDRTFRKFDLWIS